MVKFTVIVFAIALSLRAEETVTRLKSDEQIVFYPSLAQRVPGKTNSWRTVIRGCVFEPEKRRLMLVALREALELKDVEMTEAEQRIFNERARLFLVDHERGKKVFVRVGTNEFFVGKSGADGRFSGEITCTAKADLGALASRRRDAKQHAGETPALPGTALHFEVVLPRNDGRILSSEIFPLEAEGVSVISDIDDTIKITEVQDKRATLRNTFLREFQPVPGMAEFYQSLARSPRTPRSFHSNILVAADVSPLEPNPEEVRADSRRLLQEEPVTFHYISASPWQLYEPLAAFVASNGFPVGTFELKEFRWKSRKFFSLFADPVEYKTGLIEPLLKQFPRRQFILIGDSGERDPEIYGSIARKFPEQILRIYIREVTNVPADAPRYRSAFRDVSPSKWVVGQPPFAGDGSGARRNQDR